MSWVIFAPCIAFLTFAVLGTVVDALAPIPEEPDTIEVRPKLEGKEFDQWLKLYEGISIQYQRSIYTAHGLAELTWEQYGNLTGKEIWETVPNPDKVTQETA